MQITEVMTVMAIDVRNGMQRTELLLISAEGIAPMNLRNEPAFGRVIVDALSDAEAITAEDLACRVAVSELIVRSVLEAMTYLGVVEFDSCTGRYSKRFLLTS